jgi:hypothetical protein
LVYTKINDIENNHNILFIVPFNRNPNFIGRESQLTELKDQFFERCQTAKVAITGLGGVGKTQLVLELAYQIKDKHKNCSVIWIPATSFESLHQAYLNVACQLRVPGWEDEKADVERLVQEYLSKESAGRWLIIFDNADDIDMWIAKPTKLGARRLVDYLPRSEIGCIVFTTRDRKTAIKLAQKHVVDVPEMDENAATRLLQKCLIDPDLVNSKSDTATLLRELTYLPLAIIQAAAYINENRITFSDYISLLGEQEEDVIDLLREDFEDEGRYHDVKNPVATTWLISFEQIRKRDPLAADYLSFMACIEPKDIPRALLPKGSSQKKEMDAIGTLDTYSFIFRRSADEYLDLHRLVHLVMRNWLREQKLIAQWTQKSISRLEEVFPDHDYRNPSVWRMYLPHIQYALSSDAIDQDSVSRIQLVEIFGMCLFVDGRYNEAEGPFFKVMETRKTKQGADHPHTLTSMANLASTYRNQGRWKEAETLDVYVMETSKTKLGADHPDTLTSMASLASTFWNQGRWKEAETLEVQVMETRKTKLGADHQDTMTSIGNLASTFRNQGRWKEAETLEVQVIETRKTKLGADHPHTLTSMANLASTFWNQGRWEEAETLEVQVMETSKTKLGANHPDTLTSMNRRMCY